MEDVYELNSNFILVFIFKMTPQKPMHRVTAYIEPCRSLPAQNPKCLKDNCFAAPHRQW